MLARMRRPRRLDNDVVFIAGGSRGLGLALALECASRGASLVLCARDLQALERAAARVRACGCQVLSLQCDVRNREAVAAAVESAKRVFGRIDMLIYNAGTIAVGPMESMTADDFNDAMATHFWGAYYAVESMLPVFKEQHRGRIVTIASIGGKVSVPHLLPYSVSKFALVGYSEGLRAALRPLNISVTTVCPGLMRTGSPRNAWFKGQHIKEYRWFTLSDTMPGLSIAAARAARRIIDGALRGEAEFVLSLPAQTLALVHGVAPGLVSNALAIASRFLPGPGGIDQQRAKGEASTSAATESALTALGRKAERAYNQIG